MSLLLYSVAFQKLVERSKKFYPSNEERSIESDKKNATSSDAPLNCAKIREDAIEVEAKTKQSAGIAGSCNESTELSASDTL